MKTLTDSQLEAASVDLLAKLYILLAEATGCYEYRTRVAKALATRLTVDIPL